MTGAFFLAAAALAAPPARRLPAAPGLWKITSTFAMGGLPVAPPPRTFERCVGERDREDPRAFLATFAAPEDECAIGGWTVDGGTIRWTAACAGRYRGPAAGSLGFSGDASRGEFTIEIEDARGARHPVKYRIDARREGACPP